VKCNILLMVNANLVGNIDSNWAGDLDDCRSTYGSFIFALVQFFGLARKKVPSPFLLQMQRTKVLLMLGKSVLAKSTLSRKNPERVRNDPRKKLCYRSSTHDGKESASFLTLESQICRIWGQCV